MVIKTYSELSRLLTFEERYEYLRLTQVVGDETFGFDRYMNQMFYGSREWRSFRNEIIVRDNGCDLGIADRGIYDEILIHHINPITPKDIKMCSKFLMNPEYAITTSRRTHNAIHYGDKKLLIRDQIERTRNDTCPWKNL